MLIRLLSQLALATTLLQLYPADAGVVERYATLPVSEMRPVGVYDALSLMNRRLPVAPDADRAPTKVEPTSVGVVTSAVSATVVDRSTGMVLYEKNGDEPRSIGSISKLMTAYVFLRGNPDLDAPAVIVPEDVRSGGVQHVSVNDTVTVRDLLRASLVGSDNSATAALVRISGMREGDFVGRMNEMAAEIGMRATTFLDPTGLSPDNRAIVSDVARLLDAALSVDVIRETTQMSSASFVGASGRVYSIRTTDDLLGSFLNQAPYAVVGGKTGYLPEAGYCLGSLVSENGGHEIMVVVLGSETIAGRFQDVKALAAWAYKAYEWPDERNAGTSL